MQVAVELHRQHRGDDREGMREPGERAYGAQVRLVAAVAALGHVDHLRLQQAAQARRERLVPEQSVTGGDRLSRDHERRGLGVLDPFRGGGAIAVGVDRVANHATATGRRQVQ